MGYRAFHESLELIQQDLANFQERTDSILGSYAEPRGWKYFSRPKPAASALQKALFGEYSEPLKEFKDLVAGTLMVINPLTEDEVREFVEWLATKFEIVDAKKPAAEAREFIYDDHHYIVRLPEDDPWLLNKGLAQFQLEIQVKTALRYGWAVAQRELAFKPSRPSWEGARASAQSKAMVEAIEDLHAAALSAPTPTPYPKNVGDALTSIEAWWERDLPADRRRLAEFVLHIHALVREAVDLDTLLSSERAKDLGQRKSLCVEEALTILVVENLVDRGASLPDNVLVLVSSEMETESEACAAVPGPRRVQY